jgi:hypothetical protein
MFCNGFLNIFKFFASISDACFKFSSVFRYMLQIFHLDVLKVD